MPRRILRRNLDVGWSLIYRSNLERTRPSLGAPKLARLDILEISILKIAGQARNDGAFVACAQTKQQEYKEKVVL